MSQSSAQANRTNKKWIMVKVPKGALEADCFELVEEAVPEAGEGEVLLRNLYFSCDPTQLGWMTGAADYMEPVKIGDPMKAGATSQVIESNNPNYKVGDIVGGVLGWSEYWLSNGTDQMGAPLGHVTQQIPIPVSMGLLHITGFSAYFGLLDLGKPVPGDRVFISGAAGAVGSIAGQIAKIAGCKVIGTAGTDEKCDWVKNELGFDDCINYKTENIPERLKEFAPKGLDIYFDNVGGQILDDALARLANGARVVLCGGISGYEKPQGGPQNLMMLALRRATIAGFIVLDYMARFGEAGQRLGEWYATGQLKSKEDIVEGFENCPAALKGLFTGDNMGKRLIHIADPD